MHMEDTMEFLAELPISSDALGLIIAGIIFIVTVILIAKKLISFVITVVLLFFAIASGMAIAHNDLVREYFRKEKVPHEQHNENFFEPLRAEAVHLLNRIVDLLHTEGSSTASSTGNTTRNGNQQPQQTTQQAQQTRQQIQQQQHQEDEAPNRAER